MPEKPNIKVVDTDGSELVVVRRTDLEIDSREARELALADNAVAYQNLAWDKENLQKVADDFGVKPEEWGVDGVKWPKQETEIKEDDFDPDKDVKSRVKPGDIWQLGNHRLMCGDSTDLETVKSLMGGGIS